MSSPIYPLDITGLKPDNRITNEVHTITEPTKILPPIVIPKWAPMFAENAVLKVDGVNLVEGVDFEFCYLFNEARTHLDKYFYGGVWIKNRELFGATLTIDYNTIGSEFAVSASTVIIDATRTLTEARTMYWDQIVGVPYKLPLTEHLDDLADLKGWDDMVEATDSIANAIDGSSQLLSGKVQTLVEQLEEHIDNDDNPHDVTKAQIGLGNVPNFSKASINEARTKDVDNRLMTPRMTYAQFEHFFNEFLKHHAEDESLHPQSLQGVGGGNLNNWPVATLQQAQDGTGDAYMSAPRTKDAIVRGLSMQAPVTTNPTMWLGDRARFTSTAPGLPIRASGATSNDHWYLFNIFDAVNGRPDIDTGRVQFAFDPLESRWYHRRLTSSTPVEWETNTDIELLQELNVDKAIGDVDDYEYIDFDDLAIKQFPRNGFYDKVIFRGKIPPRSPDQTSPNAPPLDDELEPMFLVHHQYVGVFEDFDHISSCIQTAYHVGNQLNGTNDVEAQRVWRRFYHATEGWSEWTPVLIKGDAVNTVNVSTPLKLEEDDERNVTIVMDRGQLPLDTIALGTTDLNTITEPGYYHQTGNANALLERNYPVTRAGHLEVKYNGTMGTGSAGRTQIYTVYSNGGQYQRSTADGITWTNWRPFVYADDIEDMVTRAGSQTIGGRKTFSVAPRSTVDPSNANDLTRKSYIDDVRSSLQTSISTLDGAVVKLTGNQTVGGRKTFSVVPRSNQDPTNATDLTRKSYVDDQIANVANDLTTLGNAVVRTSGNQTVSGRKTFNTVPRATADPTNANDLARKSYVDGVVGSSGFAESYGYTSLSLTKGSWWTNTLGRTVIINIQATRSDANALYVDWRASSTSSTPIRVINFRNTGHREWNVDFTGTVVVAPGQQIRLTETWGSFKAYMFS